MDSEIIFLNAFIYLSAALVAILLGKRLGVGAVLGYLLVGVLIGPCSLGLISRQNQDVMHLAEFGVVMMLFIIGLELQPSMLWNMRRKILGLGGMQVVLTALVIAVGGSLLGLPWQAALACGLILSLSSTAIILQTLSERGLSQTEAGRSTFAVLLFQDIAVIPIIAALPLLATYPAAETAGAGHGSANFLHGLPGWAQALSTIGAVLLVIFLGRWAARPLFRMIAATRQREAFTATALVLVIGVAILMSLVGLSPALGAFVAGVVLASSEYRHELESDLAPFKGMLLGIFFIGIGIGIDFTHIANNLPSVLGLTLGLIFIKGILLMILGRVNGLGKDTSFLFACSMAAGGEFAFVLLSIALPGGILDAETGRTLTAVVAISMALTPPLIILSQKIINGRRSEPTDDNQRESDVEDEESPVIICGFGRYGHTVGRLLRTQRIGCTVLDRDEDQIDLLRSIGIPVFYGDASRPDLLAAAGAAKAKIIVIALKDGEVVTNMIHTIRHSFPHLKIYLRAHSRLEAYEYFDLGENNVFRETLDSSLMMSMDIMKDLGFEEAKASKIACHYRKNDEKFIRQMAKHRHNRKEYIGRAKQYTQALDELMRRDLDGDDPDLTQTDPSPLSPAPPR
ncbi:monovalent cation:proton antiporter-2 (CPA2) family protein [Luteolibacter algae]|uniref:Monovalent cation:proton antiporter-2 (CPA2) family protein n=1 Tax=Luteolibacter algae TaxID=454151 RepID=A0ABW5D2V9_9BACT